MINKITIANKNCQGETKMRLFLPIFLLLAVFSLSCSTGNNAHSQSQPQPIAWENVHLVEVSHYPISIPRTMVVTVTDHEKKPLPDAEVVVTGTDGGFFAAAMNPPLKMQGQTDQNGKAVLRFPDEWFEGKITHVWLNVRTARYTHSRSRLWAESRNPRPGNAITVPEELAVEFDGDLIAIQVLDEAGQSVEGAGMQLQRGVDAQISDAQGMLAFGPITGHQLDNTSQTIWISPPDFQNQTLDIKRTDLIHPTLTVTLQSGNEIFGKIIDEHGQPVAGVKIFAIGEKRATDRETVSDAGGRYCLKGLYPSDQMLIMSNEGKRLHLQELRQSELGTENNVTLRDAVPIRIRVVTEDGQPLHGVKIEPKHTVELGKFRYEYPKENILLYGGSTSTSDKTHFTDENGFWEWQNVPANVGEEMEFQIDPSRAVPHPPKDMAYRISDRVLRFSPREEPYIVTATLDKAEPSPFRLNFTTWQQKSQTLKVRVLDENLRPLAGALVEPCSGYGDSYGHHIQVEEPFPTNENGIVCFDFRQTDVSDIQDFWIKVSAKGYRSCEFFHTDGIVTTAHARTSSKVLPDEVEVVLSPVGKLVGRVWDENGNPVEGATLVLARGHATPSTTPVLSDKDGKWIADISNFSLNTDFSTQVRATKEGYLNAMTWLRSFPDITLQKAKPVSFRVVDDKRQPLEGVQITSIQSSIQPSSDLSERQTNAKGEFRADIVPRYQSDKAEILLQKDGWTPQWIILDLTGKTENLRFSLKPAKDLRVRFSFEGEEKLPVVAEVAAMMSNPVAQGGYGGSITAKQWNDFSQDDDGIIFLKDAPDCRALYYFHVPNDGVSMLRGGRGYGAWITPNDDGQVVQAAIERPKEREMRNNPNDFGQATPYGLIYYEASP